MAAQVDAAAAGELAESQATEDAAVATMDAEQQAAAGYAEDANALKGINDILNADAEDESLRKYKEQLLGAAAQGNVGDSSGPRVQIESFDVLFEDGHPEICFPGGDVTELVIKEKANYKFRIKFRVNGDIVAGLTYATKIKKLSVAIDSDETVLGSYPPAPEPHEFIFPRHDWFEAPSGMLGRGAYTITNVYTDADGVEHLRTSFSVKIKKDWE